MNTLGTLAIDVVPDLRNFGRDLGRQVDTSVRGAERDFTRSFARIGVVAAAAGAGIAAAIAGAGFGAFQLGAAFDDAYDTIRTGTGATGDALAALQDDFRAVAASVPDSFGTVGTAISDLNERLGLTGQPLQALAEEFLDLSRVTGTDVASNIEAVTRVFGDWGVAVDDQAATMDELFRASQATGVGVDQLSQTVVQFGGPLRQLGFSFEESIAMIGQFQAEGVNTELVLGSMRQALGRMARAGEEPIETFERVTEQIAAAGSAGEANALALELFGAEAGPDMAAAIREGRFEIADLLATIEGGSDTITSAADDTADFAERWGEFRNRIGLALEPLATGVFNALGTAMDAIGPHVEVLVERLSVGLMGAFQALSAWWATNGPVVTQIARDVFDALRTAIAAVVPFVQQIVGFLTENWRSVLAALAVVIGGALVAAIVSFGTALAAAMTPVTLIVGAIAALAAGAVYAYTHWEGFRNVVDGVVAWFRDVAAPAIAEFAVWVVEAFQRVAGWVEQNWPQIRDTILQVVNAIVGWVQEHWPGVRDAIVNVLEAVRGYVEGFIAVVQGAWELFGDNILTFVRDVWDLIQGVFESTLDVIEGIFATFAGLFTGNWSAMWNGIKDVFGGIWDAIQSALDFVLGTLQNALDVALTAIDTAWDAAWGAIRDFFSGIWQDIVGAFESKWLLLRAAYDLAVGALKNAWNTFTGDLKQRFEDIWNGIVGFFVGEGGIVTQIRDALAGLIGSYSQGGGGVLGLWYGLLNGLKSNFETLWNGIVTFFGGDNGIVTRVQTAFTNLIGSYSEGGGGVLGLWFGLLDGIKSNFEEMWNGIVGFFTGDDGLEGRMGRAVEVVVEAVGTAWEALKGVLAAPVNWVITNVINRFLGAVRGIASALGFDVGLADLPTVPTAHSGGVVGQLPRTGGPLKPGEELVKTQRGEGIIPRDAMMRLGSDRFERIRRGAFDEDQLPAERRGNVPVAAGIMDVIRGAASSVLDVVGTLVSAVARPAVEGALGLVDQATERFGFPGRVVGGAARRVGEGILGWLSSIGELVESLRGVAGQLTGEAFALGGGYGARILGRLSANTADAVAFVRQQWGVRDIGTVGGRPGPSDHPYGKALDAMVDANTTLGTEIARWFVQNPQAFGTKYVIWYEQINSGSGWRPYRHYLDPEGLNDTLSHRDHPHISFLADGGYITRPTLAVMGEAGGEIVGPEDKLEEIFGRVLERMGRHAPVTVQVQSDSRDPWEQGRVAAFALRMT